MKGTIWKFAICQHPAPGEWPIDIPAGTQLLHAGMQGDTLCVWGICQPNEPKRRRRFAILGTGQEVNEVWLFDDNHLGTVHDGDYVWHVFDAGADYEDS